MEGCGQKRDRRHRFQPLHRVIGKGFCAGQFGQRGEIAARVKTVVEGGERAGQRPRPVRQAFQPPGGGLERHVGIKPIGISHPQRPPGGIVALADGRAPGGLERGQAVFKGEGGGGKYES